MEHKTKQDYNIVRKFSDKSFDFTKTKSLKIYRKVSSTNEGILESKSGYLVICDLSQVQSFQPNFNFYGDIKKGINLNSKSWGIPKMMQGKNVVAFSNLWGDGMFAILTSNKRIYIETELPSIIDKDLIECMKNWDRKDRINSKICRLEGVVGIGGGKIAITDPEIHTIEHSENPERYWEMSTIVKTTPGIYACKFIDNNKIVSVRKIK